MVFLGEQACLRDTSTWYYDFENSCAAYDKAVELAEDYLIHLNYAITLYTNDEIERARKQYSKFETLFKRQSEENKTV